MAHRLNEDLGEMVARRLPEELGAHRLLEELAGGTPSLGGARAAGGGARGAGGTPAKGGPGSATPTTG